MNKTLQEVEELVKQAKALVIEELQYTCCKRRELLNQALDQLDEALSLYDNLKEENETK